MQGKEWDASLNFWGVRVERWMFIFHPQIFKTVRHGRLCKSWCLEWWCLQDIYIYISISIVLPAGSSQGKLGRKVTNLPTQSYHFSKFSPTDLIISGFESNFTPVRWMHSLQNCFWFAKKNLLRMRFFDNKKLQIQFFHHFHPLFFGCCWDLPFFSSFSV